MLSAGYVSFLGVPLIGVGLLYRAGYFAQGLSADGWQLEHYPSLDPHGLPVKLLRQPDGSAVVLSVPLPEGRTLHAPAKRKGSRRGAIGWLFIAEKLNHRVLIVDVRSGVETFMPARTERDSARDTAKLLKHISTRGKHPRAPTAAP